ncbi:hypothetical protein [Qipengyuania spongiae]|uniref:DUF3739 domain-containing protein n=1 Tax=Qipengyuania spongiae TaxID=2909673 RepID=A0ABY5SZ19_9SPHN|nr:hypothetical protein [Qipengyuania spongiae]UVI39580.1 hypothetical protein L1F33_01030 [Qipengyuania spongiae]
MASTPDPLHAQSDDLPQILTESELAEARGGFVVAGMEIRLGADLRTYLNGELALRTTISWEDDGPKTDQWVSATLAPASALAIGGILANGNLALNVNGQPMFLANEGQTALLQRTDGQIQNVAFNTASGIDLRQEADISLAVANYQMFRDAMAPAILMSGLGDAISHAAIGATAP